MSQDHVSCKKQDVVIHGGYRIKYVIDTLFYAHNEKPVFRFVITTINPERTSNLDFLHPLLTCNKLIWIKLVFISNGRFRHPDPFVKGLMLREHASTEACGSVPLVYHLAQAEEQYVTQPLFTPQDFSLKGRNFSVSS